MIRTRGSEYHVIFLPLEGFWSGWTYTYSTRIADELQQTTPMGQKNGKIQAEQ